MQIDHIFIFSNNDADEADELVKAGFTEGSRRLHPGQGTANRKFYFENFFLEILYVTNEHELANGPAAQIGLAELSNFQSNHRSRFGLCLVNSPATDNLFKNALDYQPSYFPEGKAIKVINNQEKPYLPWTFRLPFKSQNKATEEPMSHENGIHKLTKAIFGISDMTSQVDFIKAFDSHAQIDFESSHSNRLKLVFDEGQQGKEMLFKSLDLLIAY